MTTQLLSLVGVIVGFFIADRWAGVDDALPMPWGVVNSTPPTVTELNAGVL